ncbi:integrase [Microbacterium testaceum StLB037]|uniref:Integrase n=1 Tax=Microbacterium testaceum (strain StLB037) TaxID=979556 RepID=E8N9G9_MICTS|nr:tyrosine-type recombinase/integrase [Microbacterium testaceum]BAJ73216.1 integrase [Microbacterium testaceum StLB037]
MTTSFTFSVHTAAVNCNVSAPLYNFSLVQSGLRHTGATWMADAGVPLHVLQEILGHASMETTRGYLHPDDRHLASAAEQASAFLSPAGQRHRAQSSTPPTRSV